MNLTRLGATARTSVAALVVATALVALPGHAGIPGDGPWKARSWALIDYSSSNLTSVVRWNRCGTPIGYQIYMGDVPSDRRAKLERLAKVEVAELAKRTRMPFEYQGPASQAPNPNVEAPGTNLVVAFVSGNQANGVVRGGAVSSTRFTPWSDWYLEHNSLTTLVDARVYVDWKDTKTYSLKRGKAGLTVPNVLRRGLATAMGLDRVNDRKQIMYQTLSLKTPGSWGTGDLHALNLAGQSNWCDDPTFPTS